MLRSYSRVQRWCWVGSGSCVREMCFGRDNRTKHDKNLSLVRSCECTPSVKCFTVSKASTSVSVDGPPLEIIACVACCGTSAGKMRISCFGSWQTKFLVHLTLDPEEVTLTSNVTKTCDDFVLRSDTNNNQVRYRTRARWWRSRPAHNLQRSNGAGPPCHPWTPPKAAQPTAESPQPVKKEFGDASTSYSTRQGRERGFSPPRDVRFLSAFHTHKARSLSTRLGPARPLGTRRGDGRSLIQANRLSDPRPRFRKHVLGLRLSATPSDHAFRPRLSRAFQPRLSATLSDHVFRRAIRVEDVVCTPKRPKKLCSRISVHL